MAWNDLSPASAAAALSDDADLLVLDVRTPGEYLAHRIDGATLLPVQELQMRVQELDPDRRYLVVCEHGVRSVAACGYLAELGFEALSNLQGGMAHWSAQGLPTVSGPAD